MQDQEETVKRNNSAALEQSPVSPSRDTHKRVFKLFCRYWNTLQEGEVNDQQWYAAYKLVDHRPGGTRMLLMLDSYLPQKNVREPITSSLDRYYKTFHNPL